MKRVLVIGGTSGMGLGLARAFAAEGSQVCVVGRDVSRVPALALREGIVAIQGDVTDPSAITKVVRDAGKAGLDLVVYSAGYYATDNEVGRDPSKGTQMDATNVDGTEHVFTAALPLMRKGAQMAVIASIAGLLRADPWSSHYAKSKRQVISRCEEFRKVAATQGVTLSVLVPGYVDTMQLRLLNGGRRPVKPFLQTEAHAVALMRRALEKGLPRYVFPWQLHALVRMYNLLPAPMRALRK